jgi:Putative auto-transporter adhesin, head GIN domain
VLSILVLILAVSGCIGSGSGKIVKENRSVAGFDQIVLNGNINLNIKQGDSEALVIQAEDNIVPNIVTNVNNKVLTISYRGMATPIPTKPVYAYLTVKNLNSVSTSGSGYVKADNIKTNNINIVISGSGNSNFVNLNSNRLKINISGSGDVKITGKIENQNVKILGSGRYIANDLNSSLADIIIEGSGKATVNVTKKLNIKISGSGEVTFSGNPQVKQTINGSGEVNKVS